MRKLLYSAVALTALANQAFAADLPYQAPAPIFTWTGFYVGAQIGGEFGRASNYVPSTGTGLAWDNNGVFGGLHLGYNYAFNSLVFGLQGEFNGSSASGSVSASGWTHDESQSWLGSVDGRVGFAVDRALIYAIGGVAFTDTKETPSFGGVGYSFSNNPTGYDVGGGIEYALAGNWTARLEYRYYDFGSTNWAALGAVPAHSLKQTDQTARIGISYKFGG